LVLYPVHIILGYSSAPVHDIVNPLSVWLGLFIHVHNAIHQRFGLSIVIRFAIAYVQTVADSSALGLLPGVDRDICLAALFVTL